MITLKFVLASLMSFVQRPLQSMHGIMYWIVPVGRWNGEFFVRQDSGLFTFDDELNGLEDGQGEILVFQGPLRAFTALAAFHRPR